MDPDPGGPKTYRSGSATIPFWEQYLQNWGLAFHEIYYKYKSETAITFCLIFLVNEKNYLSFFIKRDINL
jgi:hypothetical protein